MKWPVRRQAALKPQNFTKSQQAPDSLHRNMVSALPLAKRILKDKAMLVTDSRIAWKRRTKRQWNQKEKLGNSAFKGKREKKR